MTTLVQRGARSPYSDGEITQALTALALNSGNAVRTCEQTKIPESTLRQWRDHSHPEDYKRIVQEQVPAIYGRIAETCEGLALEQAEVEAEILAHLRTQLSELKPDQAATALRNVAVSKAVNVDKASLVRGRPSEIRIELGVEDLVRAIGKEFGPVLPVVAESTAQDITEDRNGDTPHDADIRA